MGDIGKERRMARKSLMTGANIFRSICEVLREIYDVVHELDEEPKEKITELLVDAMVMAKKMDNRLGYYHKTYQDTTGRAGKGLVRIHGTSARRAFRANRT